MPILRALLALLAAAVAWVLALPVALLVLPFWLVRAVAGWIRPRVGPVGTMGEESFIDFDPELGWRPRASNRSWATDLNGDVWTFSTDPDGWRGRQDLDDAKVVVFGDSFAFGYAVEDPAFFADLDPSLPIKSIGAPGYSLVQCLLSIKKLAPRMAGRDVVLLIYVGNDLEDTVRPFMGKYRAPFLRERGQGEWEIVSHHVREEPWPFPSNRRNVDTYVDICLGAHVANRVLSAAEWVIREARDTVEREGGRLHVFTVPDLSRLVLGQIREILESRSDAARFDPGLPDRRLGEICQRLGVGFVSLADHLATGHYLPNDVHWNAEGHRIVNRVIKEAMNARSPTDARGDRPAEDVYSEPGTPPPSLAESGGAA